MEKECGYSFSSDVFLHGTKNHPLSKPMVYHDQKGIKADGRGQVSDKVTRDLLEGVGCRGVNEGEWGNGGVCVGLVLLTGRTAFNIFADVGGKAGPPEFSCDGLVSFQVSRVAGRVMIMAMLEDGVAKGFIVGDIDATLIGKDACYDLPVRKVGAEGKGNILIHGLESLEDEGITS